MTPLRLTGLMCAAEILGMLGFSTFAALIPVFEHEWVLSKTESGLISGVFFAGYVAVVPVLTALTDRIDPKRVILYSMALGGLGALGYALLADGFWPALLFRCLQGAGLAGIYMPGLKALSDGIEGDKQSRAVAFYTASFGVGAGLSFLIAGEVEQFLDWRWAFGVTAAGAVGGFVMVAAFLPAAAPTTPAPETRLLDFRPVLRNREAMRFILGYLGHNWELFALRSWMVPFLAFALAANHGAKPLIAATTVAALATFLGVPSSIMGNEMAVRLGRVRWVLMVTGASVLLSLVTGFAAGLSYGLAVGLCLAYGVLTTGDSAALTAGTVAAAAPGQRGATLAMHSFIGFMGGIVAPPIVGGVLDLIGRESVTGWGFGFIAVGLGSAIAFALVGRRAAA